MRQGRVGTKCPTEQKSRWDPSRESTQSCPGEDESQVTKKVAYGKNQPFLPSGRRSLVFQAVISLTSLLFPLLCLLVWDLHSGMEVRMGMEHLTQDHDGLSGDHAQLGPL